MQKKPAAVDYNEEKQRLESRPSSKRLLAPAALALIVAWQLQASAADLDREVNFSIPAQPLSQALAAFSRQSDMIVVASSDATNGKTSNPVNGNTTAAKALKKLLQGTELGYKQDKDGAIVVTKPMAWVDGDHGDLLRLAQSENAGAGVSSAGSEQALGRNRGEGFDSSKEEANSKLEEIVVTAQRREQSLQDVPIAISVLSGEKLDAFTGGGVSDALAYLPGIALTETGDSYISGNASFISVRGVSASNSHDAGASPTAVYIDGVPYGFVKSAFFPNLAPYDLDRVEVLRGPHGSLYGANALNGVVRVFTRDADLDDFELKTRLSGSSIKSGGETYQGDAAINVPLVAGKLAARTVVGYSAGGGWIDDASGKKNTNDAKNVNVRLKVRAQPTERLSIGLTGWRSHDDNGAPNLSDINDTFPGTGALGESKAKVDFDVAGLEVGYNFPSFTATTTTSYIDFSNLTAIDVSGWLLPPVLNDDGERIDDPYTNYFDSEVFTEELNLVSSDHGSWRWSAGMYYRDAEDRKRVTQNAIVSNVYDETITSKSFAVYGELTRLFLDGKVELTGGLRHFEDRVQLVENGNFDNVGPLIVRPKRTYTKVSPRAVLTWHATDEAMFYTSYGEGFRSGGDQPPDTFSFFPEVPDYKPDTLKNYEIGAKGALLGGRVVYDAAVYFIDWQDIQQGIQVAHPFFPGSFFFAIVNGDSASGMGYEIATTFKPIEGLDLGVSYSRSDLTNDAAAVTPRGTVLIAKGSRLAYSPKYTLGSSASYVIPLGATGLEARLSAAVNYSPGLTAIFLKEGDSVQVTEGQSTMASRANLAISSKAGWTATFFVENLRDERTGGLKIPLENNFLAPSRQPRMMGLQFEYKYR